MSSHDDADGERPSRFAAVDDQYDPHAVEDRVFDYWEAVDAYEQTVEHRADEEPFFFVDGPPYTSGAAHMGTTWNKTLKDAYIRYYRMCGYDVTDRPGYDMHGLPIETKVEERLDFDSKKDIEEYGEENFIEECKEFADEQLEGLQDDFKSIGVWMDWDDPYKTVSPEYMEAAWWGFKQAHERGLVEQGKRAINQCPRCETAIANNEVERDEVGAPSIYVRFPLSDRGDEHHESPEGAGGETASREGSLVIWTTTPWTIVANTFVAVDEDLTYVGIKGDYGDEGHLDDDLIYVAEAVAEDVAEWAGYEEWEIVEELSGEDLVGWEYEHPLQEEVPEYPKSEGAGQVYAADYVEADRTGLVHSAPGHGEEDFERGQELGLDVFSPVGPDGVFTEQAGAFEGKYVRDADDDVISTLDEHGLLLANEEGHSINEGHCWRCDSEIVRIVTDQWFITVSEIKDELLANIDDSEWHPQEARDERFRNFVEDSPDWNVSRQRYWGIPIPIWTPEDAENPDADEWLVVGDREELAELVDQDVDPGEVDLHKPTVDDLTITTDGTTYTRVADVFDVWLDSSVATWGTLNYPSQEEAFEELWPADLIMEAHDQTRGWFWSQLGMGTAALGEVPYQEVLMHGWALAEDGRKMSKSIGNIVTPHEVIEKHGADPMRLFLLSVNPQGDDMRFSWDEIENMQRDLNILWNVFRFPLPYMRLDDFEPGAIPGESRGEGEAQGASDHSSGQRPREEAAEAVTVADATLETVDEWVLSRLQAVKGEMAEHWDNYRQDRALDALLEFVVEDVSRFYIQVVRERMWEEEESDSKQAAYATFYRVLTEAVALFAPYAPLVADEIYGTLTGDAGYDTVHMCDWPEADPSLRDPALEDDIEVVQAVEEAGSNARQQAERKLRWPVPEVVVDVPDDRVADAIERRADLIADRLNARDVSIVGPDEGGWGELQYSAQADMSVLGPAFGDDAGRIMGALNEARIDEPTLATLEDAVEDATGMDVDLTEEMVEFVTETPEGISGTEFEALDSAGVVYVDTSLTEDIESEGYAREVIRRIQEMRKELDLDIEEEITVDLDVADDRVADLVRERETLIAEEVRAEAFGAVEDGHRETWDVEGIEMTISIEPVAEAAA